ncbi:hypothetical protein [Pendulispora albinea]|uniref:Phage baseplate protein n=1 Tax=Pendulispora albinea TaxID=2741071 RepID=A0ABZ2MAU4_9BACT
MLPAETLLGLWEEGESARSDPARALLLLAFAHPQIARQELARWSIGRREEELLALRERYLGRTLELEGACPRCEQAVVIAFDARDLPRPGPVVDDGASYRLEHEGVIIHFRLLDGADLEAAGGCGDVEDARRFLLRRCVVRLTGADGSEWVGGALSEAMLEALEHELDRREPLAVMQMELDCPDCSHRWHSRLDISEIVWSEFAGLARRLLIDVATLARAYHWSEASILAMSGRRRRMYLELAEA